MKAPKNPVDKKSVKTSLEAVKALTEALLDDMNNAQKALESHDDPAIALGPFGCRRRLRAHFTKLDSAISNLELELPDRMVVPTGLSPTGSDLLKFDPGYFDLGPEFDRTGYSVDQICYDLTTWVHDNSDDDGDDALQDVKRAFGQEVYEKVAQNWRDGNHDT